MHATYLRHDGTIRTTPCNPDSDPVMVCLALWSHVNTKQVTVFADDGTALKISPTKYILVGADAIPTCDHEAVEDTSEARHHVLHR